MNRVEDNLADVQWVAQCAHRLRERWPHADVVALEEAAWELWRHDELRLLAAADAASQWLAPLEQAREGTASLSASAT
jgi:hypothetical protein